MRPFLHVNNVRAVDKLIPVTTLCSQPLCAGLRSSVTHGICSVTDIPELTSDLYHLYIVSMIIIP